MTVKNPSEIARSCPTLSDSTDCSLPGSSVHGIFQARVLEWDATAFSKCAWHTSIKTPQPVLYGQILVSTPMRNDSSSKFTSVWLWRLNVHSAFFKKKNDIHLLGSGSPQTASFQAKNQEQSLSPGSKAPTLRTWTSSRVQKSLSSRSYHCVDCLGTLTYSFHFFIKCPVREPRRLLSQGLGASPGPPGQRPPGKGWLSRSWEHWGPPHLPPQALSPLPFTRAPGGCSNLWHHIYFKKQFLVSESGSWKRNTLNLKQKTSKNLFKNLLNIA